MVVVKTGYQDIILLLSHVDCEGYKFKSKTKLELSQVPMVDWKERSVDPGRTNMLKIPSERRWKWKLVSFLSFCLWLCDPDRSKEWQQMIAIVQELRKPLAKRCACLPSVNIIFPACCSQLGGSAGCLWCRGYVGNCGGANQSHVPGECSLVHRGTKVRPLGRSPSEWDRPLASSVISFTVDVNDNDFIKALMACNTVDRKSVV